MKTIIKNLIFDPDVNGVFLGPRDLEKYLISINFYEYAIYKDNSIYVKTPWSDKDIKMFRKLWPELWNMILKELQDKYPERFGRYQKVKI